MGQQVFTSSGTFTPATGVTSVDVLVVGGGGGGGGNSAGTTSGGGGGGGQVNWQTGVPVTAGLGCVVTIGTGGAASSNSQGGNGNPSRIAVPSATSYTAAVAADSPAIYLRLGDSSGSTAVDSSGNGRNGTLSGSPGLPTLGQPSLLTFDSDTCYQFVRGQNQIVTVSSVPSGAPSALTFEAWVSTLDSVGGYFITRYGSTTGERIGYLRINVQTPEFGLFNSAGTLTAITGSSLTVATTHHIVGTYDGTTMRLYVDGTQVATSTAVSGTLQGTGAAALRLAATATSGSYSGFLDEAAYYTTALSAARVAAHYASGAGTVVAALGGGGGGDGGQSSGSGLRNGLDGASGGGGGSTSSPAGTGGTGSAGSNGGAGFATATTTQRGSGGGGGAGGAGQAGTAGAPTGGDGGAGSNQSANVGTSVGVSGFFGGGGGGGHTTNATTNPGNGDGGTGGGGHGGTQTPTVAAVAGTANTGGGGGGGSQNQQGAAGGSGIVVVQWADPPPNVPTSVAAGTATTTTIPLSWAAPSGGGTVTSYDVRRDGGTPTTGVTSPYTFTGLTPGTSYTLEVRAVGPGGTSSWVGVTASTLDEPPGVPTSVAATPAITSIDLSWSPPLGPPLGTGGPVTSYDVRIDGGTPVTGATSPHTFPGLTGGTSYTVEVRAVGPGGTSSWVGVTTETLPAFTGAYRVRVTAGDSVWEATSDSEPGLGVTLPLSFGWSIPENVDFFPTQADPITGSFGLVVESMDDAGLGLHDPVLIEMWVPAAASVPWQRVPGVVSQMEVSVLPSGRKLVSVSFTDPSLLLASVPVGWDDWPQENVFDRVERICTEAGITTDWIHNESSMGTLPARTSSGPTTVLAALREALQDDADRNTSIDPDNPLYGRLVWSYAPDVTTLFLRVLDRRYFHWPADGGGPLEPDLVRIPGEDGALDGCAVEVGGTWSRLPIDQPTYVVVDGGVFGDDTAPGAIPYFRTTRFVDTSPSNPSATARVYLGRSLVPPEPGFYQATDWRSNTLTHLSHLDPEPVAGWFGTDPGGLDPVYASMPWAEGGIRGVIVEPVDSSLTLDGNTWILGTLTGARFTLPPGGHHYVEVTLRPDIYDTQLVD